MSIPRSDPPPLLLNRGLRSRARAESRSWREEDERSLQIFHERSRRFEDVVHDAYRRGLQTIAYLAQLVVAGRLRQAGSDSLSLGAEDVETHVRFDSIVTLAFDDEGRSPTDLRLSGPTSFLAQMRQLEMSQTEGSTHGVRFARSPVTISSFEAWAEHGSFPTSR